MDDDYTPRTNRPTHYLDPRADATGAECHGVVVDPDRLWLELMFAAELVNIAEEPAYPQVQREACGHGARRIIDGISAELRALPRVRVPTTQQAVEGTSHG